jgi:serine/threonine protein kinase/class 3 adenylate cyclase
MSQCPAGAEVLMSLERYPILSQRGSGADGVSYRAKDAEDAVEVEIRVLHGACTTPEWWPVTVRRLRLACLLNHPTALRIRALHLDNQPPRIVLDWLEGDRLERACAERIPLPPDEAAGLSAQLAEALAEAHRLGLAHGRLAPGEAWLDATGRPRLDFTGLETHTAPPLPFATRPSVGAWAARFDSTRDIRDLGQVLLWLLAGPGAELDAAPPRLRPTLHSLLRAMLADDPLDRPSAEECARQLGEAAGQPLAAVVQNAARDSFVLDGLQLQVSSESSAGATNVVAPPLPERFEGPLDRTTLGRFRLLERLGEGGMGAVYRAVDETDGTLVAVKVLQPEFRQRPQALRRLRREARLLAEANHPCIANLLEVNEDAGVPYLVLEFVPGKTLEQWLEQRGRLEETEALTILAEVARGLAEAHRLGIIHRDIKPDNILLRFPESEEDPPRPVSVKLADFGLARHVVESASLHVTRTGMVLGTPLYMAPEQWIGAADVDARADVYALGGTLFRALAGRPPFQAGHAWQLVQMHQNEPPPSLRRLNPALSDGVCALAEKCLAKHPDHRYADAGALLDEMERLLRGEPSTIQVHPRLPSTAAGRPMHFEFRWELAGTPEQLWPHVANTDRLNRAAGLPAVRFRTESDGGESVRRYGEFRKAGLAVAWREHPFEWIEGRRHGVLREYSRGPLHWFVSIVDLKPRAGGGTVLTHSVHVQPAGWVGRLLAAIEIGVRGRKALDRVYRRVDGFVTGQFGTGSVADPFERSVPPSRAQRRRVDGLLAALTRHGVEPAVAERVGDFLLHAPPQDVARIRPLALARRLDCGPRQMLAACLYAVREGALTLLWDLLCPRCRIPAGIRETLRDLREHGHCAACNLAFELDFSTAVEMVFGAHPSLRASDRATYCVGGPAHSPHVVAQVRVAPGEQMELDLALSEGAYRLGGPQLPWALNFRVQPGAGRGRLDVPLARRASVEPVATLGAGRQLLVLTNGAGHELLVRVERRACRDDAVTAADAAALPLFRELFPHEVLSPGQAARVARVTLLLTDLPGARAMYQRLGDARAFEEFHRHLGWLRAAIVADDGAVVKTVGEGVLASFAESLPAVRLALDLQAQAEGRGLRLAIHRGPAMAATFNERLDYFGTTVQALDQLLPLARDGMTVLSQAVAADPQVAALLEARALPPRLCHAEHAGESAHLFPCLIVAPR